MITPPAMAPTPYAPPYSPPAALPAVQPVFARPVNTAPTAGPLPTADIPAMIAQLGQQTRIGSNGLVQFNEPLLARIVAQREQAVQPLYAFLASASSIPAFLEGLQAAERLAEAGVAQTASLYPAVSRWNTHPDPLVQIYLAGFYREIHNPSTFGPMLATLVNQSVARYPLQSTPAYTITEEVGGTLLEQLADYTAQRTLEKLQPFLPPPAATAQPLTPNPFAGLPSTHFSTT